ncbi:MAG: OOP family OmpA-OmpF porin [Glaciecola sp.]|jgi:OOP family OmpA-OmpF porin
MKKLTLCVAAALTVAMSTVQAQETKDAPPYDSWVGGFVQYYGADITKIEPIGGLGDGFGVGGEVGFRFDPSWGVRFELGRVSLDNDSDDPRATDQDGIQLGGDMMYFLENDAAYFFGGLRSQSLDSANYGLAAMGVGKHWEMSDTMRIITEVAAYHDFGQGHREYSAKLGLAYIFGATKVVSNPDTDGDGVYDAVDRCPATPVGQQVDATGCNIDMDGDGVLNAQDQCPNTPAGSVVDAKGCEINVKGCAVNLDTDNDGVLDSVDNCLGTPATDKVDATGCSVFEQKEVSVALDMLFGNNSSIITNPDSARIQEFVAFMARFPNTQAVIEGHSSATGNADYNQMLSEKRAKSVRTLLINEYELDGSRLEAIGYGVTRLKDTANTAEAHRINRRIEVKVTALVESKVTR